MKVVAPNHLTQRTSQGYCICVLREWCGAAGAHRSLKGLMYFLRLVVIAFVACLVPNPLFAQALFTFYNQGLAPVSIVDPTNGVCIRPIGDPWHLQLMAAPAGAPAAQMQPLTPLLNFVGESQPGYVSNQVFVIPGAPPGEWQYIWIRVLLGSDPATAQVLAVAGPFWVLPQVDASYSGLSPGLGELDFCKHGLFVSLYGPVDPEILSINEGDTVTWQVVGSAPAVIESYTGEWRSPSLGAGERFSYTFTNPGTYVYRVTSGSPPPFYSPGLIQVRKLAGGYPAISIVSPLDNFVVPGFADIVAVITNAPLTIKEVRFYAEDQLIGATAYPPYQTTAQLSPGTYKVTASVVDNAGQTNTSTPIRLTFDGLRLFQPFRLPQGQTVFFQCAAGGPFCVQWSDDLTTWHYRTFAQLVGRLIVVDEATTNVMQRFYKIINCL